MKARAALLGLILLGVGFGVGFWVAGADGPAAPAPPTATEALEALLDYRSDGAPAVRRALDWVDAIVAGGEAMLPRLDSALTSAPERRYGVPWQLDPPSGILSCYPTLRSALVEAVSRIGGDRAIEILVREADRPTARWTDRVAAFALLVPHADREDVREYFEKRVLGDLGAKMDGPEARGRIQVASPYLSEAAWGPVATAFTSGWPEKATMDLLTETLFDLDRERAGRVFVNTLTDPQSTGAIRAPATTALARIPERRHEALAIVLAHTDPSLVGFFMKGLSAGRFGEAHLERSARESLDLDRMIEYTKGRIADLRDQIDLMGKIGATLPEDAKRALRFGEWSRNFEDVLRQGEANLDDLEKAKKVRAED